MDMASLASAHAWSSLFLSVHDTIPSVKNSVYVAKNAKSLICLTCLFSCNHSLNVTT